MGAGKIKIQDIRNLKNDLLIDVLGLSEDLIEIVRRDNNYEIIWDLKNEPAVFEFGKSLIDYAICYYWDDENLAGLGEFPFAVHWEELEPWPRASYEVPVWKPNYFTDEDEDSAVQVIYEYAQSAIDSGIPAAEIRVRDLLALEIPPKLLKFTLYFGASDEEGQDIFYSEKEYDEYYQHMSENYYDDEINRGRKRPPTYW